MAIPSAPMHMAIVEARYYDDIADHLLQGACTTLRSLDEDFEVFTVPGALEIAPAIALLADQQKFNAYCALGCVIRGQTYHFEIVAMQSAAGLQDLSVNRRLAIGNGILTCEDHAQALLRARCDRQDKGGQAVMAAKTLWEIGRQ